MVSVQTEDVKMYELTFEELSKLIRHETVPKYVGIISLIVLPLLELLDKLEGSEFAEKNEHDIAKLYARSVAFLSNFNELDNEFIDDLDASNNLPVRRQVIEVMTRYLCKKEKLEKEAEKLFHEFAAKMSPEDLQRIMSL